MSSTEYNKRYLENGRSRFNTGEQTRATHKRCSMCKETKPASEFYLSNTNKGGLHGWCKDCSDRRTTENARKRLGVTPTVFEEMLAAQGKRCAICGTPDPGKRAFCVDHDHRTGKVRGILCTRCNSALGCALDNIETLERAAAYLRHHQTAFISELERGEESR